MKQSFAHLSKYRERTGYHASNDSFGGDGVFTIPHTDRLRIFSIISSIGDTEYPWEHVSVKVKTKGAAAWRCPTWEEMCFVKDLFWDENETVMQLHPAKSDYINVHPAVLHLWKPLKDTIPLPPLICV